MMDHPLREAFFGNLAAILGVGKDQLETAFKEAAKSSIDEATQNGYFTAAQADQLKQKVEHGRQDLFERSWGWAIRRRRFMDVAFSTIASQLGLSTSDLEQQLESGKTIADVAREKGVPEAHLRRSVRDVLKPLLDDAVKEGKIAPKFADMVIQRIEGTGAMPKAA